MASQYTHWTWITTDVDTPDDDWKRRFDVMKRSGIDAILPEVVGNSSAAYASRHLPVSGHWLEQILPLAREAGLEVHAWIHCMPCTAPQIVKAHPQWYVVNGKGESAAVHPAYVEHYKFLCPTQDEVQRFVRQRVVELAEYEGLTSIHLDYIRFPDVILAEALQPRYGIVQDREYPEYDYCYCPVCRRAFEEQAGVDPLSLEDPSANAAWREFRHERINNIVMNVLAPAAREKGKLVTAAVFPNWWNVRQQWFRWGLDAVLPMLYHNFYGGDIDWIEGQCRAGADLLAGTCPLYSGLFVPSLTPDELPAAVEASLRGGARGVSLFAAASMSDDHWKRFAEVNRSIGAL